MNCPDGATFWLTKMESQEQGGQIAGPASMQALCEQSAYPAHRNFICGGSEGVALAAAEKLIALYPGIQILGTHTPPFRPQTSEQRTKAAALIQESFAEVV